MWKLNFAQCQKREGGQNRDIERCIVAHQPERRDDEIPCGRKTRKPMVVCFEFGLTEPHCRRSEYCSDCKLTRKFTCDDAELPHKSAWHDDAGDIVNHEVENKSVKTWIERLAEPLARDWPIETIDRRGDHHPHDGVCWFVVKHRNQRCHAGKDARNRENMNHQIDASFTVFDDCHAVKVTLRLEMKLFRRRILLSGLWLVVVLSWSVVRIVAVKFWLSQYGINTVVFAVIELTSSMTYGVSSARTVLAIIDKRRKSAKSWGAVCIVAYLAPDVYIFSAGKSLPLMSYVVIVALIVVAGVVAVVDLRHRINRSVSNSRLKSK